MSPEQNAKSPSEQSVQTFSDPPRAVATWRTWVLVAFGVTAMACWVALVALAGGNQSVLITLFVLAICCSLSALLLGIKALKAREWRWAAIVPARVIKPPKGPPYRLLSFLGVIPGLDVLGAAADLFERRKDGMTLVLADGFEVITVEINAGPGWAYYRDNRDVWLCVTPARRVWLVESIAPRREWRRPVPLHLKRWLDVTLPPELGGLTVQPAQDADSFSTAL
jgi:hypothetical protein